MDHESDLDNVPLVEKTELSDLEEESLVAEEKTSTWDFLVLTIPFFGLQLAYTVQQVFGVPYLSSLGISDTHLPIYVLSGPLTGFVVPPIVAVLSDRIQSPLGKRKPFIFLGGLGTILSFLFLSSAQPIAETLFPFASRTASHIIAGMSLYALNFSIQPLQLGLRASVVDHFSPQQQPAANLWISRLQSLGSVFVALVGLFWSPAFWDLSVVVTLVLTLLMGVVALTNPTKPGSQWLESEKLAQGPISLRAHVVKLFRKAQNLPPITRKTCQVQLVSWFAWFLVLNYWSALISRIYDNNNNNNKPSDTESAANAVSSVALLFHSVSLITLAVVSMAWKKNKNETGNIQLDSDSDSEDGESDDQEDSELTRTRDILMRRIWKPSLAALAASLVGVSLLASIAKQFSFAATMVSLLLGGNGMLFALSNWVPYSLISHEASAQARARTIITEEGDTVDDDDDTPTLLAVHNMAITVPQMVASVASWLLMQSLAVLGLKQDVVWIFALSIPSALWAACL